MNLMLKLDRINCSMNLELERPVNLVVVWLI